MDQFKVEQESTREALSHGTQAAALHGVKTVSSDWRHDSKDSSGFSLSNHLTPENLCLEMLGIIVVTFGMSCMRRAMSI